MAEKTEKATPKKLRDARKKGQVAKSQDFPAAFTFIVAIGLTLGLATNIYRYLATYILMCFKLIPEVSLINQIGPIFTQTMSTIIQATLPIAGITALAGVLVSFLVTGPVFSMEVFKPNFKKFNPVENIKQKFKFKTLFEILKSMFKIGGAAILIYTVVDTSLPDLVQTAGLPVLSSALLFNAFLTKVVIRVGIFFIAIAIFDLIYQKKTFAKEMKMEKFEVKQEYKDTEGSPEIKGKRRQIAQEIAYEEGPSAVKRAKAVVTNPTHFAVAIGYEPEKYPAPFILAKGMDRIAEAIIREADKYNVPIMRNVALARELYENGKIYEYIPPETYDAVAEILRLISSIESEPFE
jgi:type III secretion protein U